MTRGLAVLALLGWLVALGAIWLLVHPQPQPLSEPEFWRKTFTDTGEVVVVTGTLTGEGLGYRIIQP